MDALAALTAMLPDATLWPLAVNVSVTVPALVTNNPLNAATPAVVFAVWAVVVPFRLPPLVWVAVTAVPSLTKFPYWSFTITWGCCAKTAPAVAVAEGCCAIVSVLADAAFTVKVPEVALLSPPSLAVKVLPVPAVMGFSALKVATPLAATTVNELSPVKAVVLLAIVTLLLSLVTVFPY